MEFDYFFPQYVSVIRGSSGIPLLFTWVVNLYGNLNDGIESLLLTVKYRFCYSQVLLYVYVQYVCYHIYNNRIALQEN